MAALLSSSSSLPDRGDGTTPLRLTFVTSNANKLAEVQKMLGPDASVSVTARAIDLVEVQAATPEEVTADKCRRAAREVAGPVLVEDTCLCLDSLKGLPGPYIKWFLGSLGTRGLVSLLAAHPDKSAQAVCTMAVCEAPGDEPILFQGRVRGKIVEPRGLEKFGWDPIFEYQGKTFAEMDGEEKNRISHRALAVEKLKAWLVGKARERGGSS